ncbi:uncharacterized protein METZ01_LOCUS454443 [marine metagenome]|uniref:Uncharacterized protein n=1 Tax=marine metagenome TaxID=408172 RepID=A0A383A1Y9_9ZZZZ
MELLIERGNSLLTEQCWLMAHNARLAHQ